MRWLVGALCLRIALATALPVASSHEIRLRYLPSLMTPESDAESYLSINWSVQNGNLYANNEQVFPPIIPMQFHAPRYASSGNKLLGDTDLKLSYALDARRLPPANAGAEVMRLRLDVLDLQSQPVTPGAVVLYLLLSQDGDHRIDRIRVEFGASGDDPSPYKDRPWHLQSWNAQVNPAEQEAPSTTESSSNGVPHSADPHTDTTFSVWTPSTRPHHRPHRPSQPFMGLVRPILLPALVGAILGVVACVVGLVVGNLLMSLFTCLGWRKRSDRQSWMYSMDDESVTEKSLLSVPRISVTNAEDI
ncbi:hypothetical protein NUU61_008398 [Penicillium alfredii]|uniref:Uncharacterized protein n=1 Tax=Penicillium alfredii TaxID=1506179 RepID=A0A9W9JZH4_9EURO|nr:uncharacterized protein NUU61_008398 [Penicillium alfredii]KAJ5087091.1 hypothetical protein NUU61_008398 [Penicillium alfredii]